jgi:hypothetical protein
MLAHIALARLRAEAGWGIHGSIIGRSGVIGHFTVAGFVDILGGKTLGAQNILGLGYLGLLSNIMSPNIGSTLEAINLTKRPRRMLEAIWLGIMFTMVFGFGIGWSMIYGNGRVRKFPIALSYNSYYGGSDYWIQLSTFIAENENLGFNMFKFGVLLIPIAVMVLLMVMNTRYFWWPFHPLGYAAGFSEIAWRFTSSAFIVWVIKGLVFRWGGLKLWKTLTTFFIGLLVGDFLVVTIQTALGVFAG